MASVLRYTESTYGDAFADVYDDWYAQVSDVAATCDVVAGLAAASAGDRPARVLELGVGTGRVAVPLAARGLDVTGIDASAAMIERLRARDPDRRVRVVEGDMVDDQPAGPFDVVLVAYNTFFNLLTDDRQADCVRAVAARLAPAGSFVVEAFVPEAPPRSAATVTVRSMTVDEVVLSVTRHDPERQRAEGHFVQLADGQPVRLRPWAIHYRTPEQLDQLAKSAGFTVAARWEDWSRQAFGPASARHVTVYSRGP
jgi:SAM-dependent methyltransferase